MAIFAATEAEREQADRDGRRDEWDSSDEEEVLSSESDGEWEYLDDEYMYKMDADYDYGYD